MLVSEQQAATPCAITELHNEDPGTLCDTQCAKLANTALRQLSLVTLCQATGLLGTGSSCVMLMKSKARQDKNAEKAR